eukprot:300618-Prymnesium_polylepis.1
MSVPLAFRKARRAAAYSAPPARPSALAISSSVDGRPSSRDSRVCASSHSLSVRTCCESAATSSWRSSVCLLIRCRNWAVESSPCAVTAATTASRAWPEWPASREATGRRAGCTDHGAVALTVARSRAARILGGAAEAPSSQRGAVDDATWPMAYSIGRWPMLSPEAVSCATRALRCLWHE